MAVGPDGTIYVSDSGFIRKVTPSGVVSTLGRDIDEGIWGGWMFGRSNSHAGGGIVVDSGGNLYITDAYYNAIWRITPEGQANGQADLLAGHFEPMAEIQTGGYADGTGADAHFNRPWGVAVAADGTVYVADTGNIVIRRITPTGVVDTLAGAAGEAGSEDGSGSSARFYEPFGMALAPDGNLLVTQTGGVRQVTPSGEVTTVEIFSHSLEGIAVTADGIIGAAEDAYTNTIQKISKASGGDGIGLFIIQTDAGASISPAGTQEVQYGGGQGFTITPDPGFHIAAVAVDGVPQESPSSYSFTNVRGNHTIQAVSRPTRRSPSPPRPAPGEASRPRVPRPWIPGAA